MTQVLPLLAILLSVASLGVSILSYRRNGVHLVVEVAHRVVAKAEELEKLYVVRVLNKRTTAAQVSQVQFQTSTKKEFFLVARKPTGNLPRKVDGLHMEEWTMDSDLINISVRCEHPVEDAFVRVRVTTGSGKRFRSPWIKCGPLAAMVEAAQQGIEEIHNMGQDDPEITVQIEDDCKSKHLRRRRFTLT